jgi:hypothetical protein
MIVPDPDCSHDDAEELIHINANPWSIDYETDTSREPRGMNTLATIGRDVSDQNATNSSGSDR